MRKDKEEMNKKEKEGRKCLRNGRFSEALDRFNESAHEYQKNGEIDRAIKLAKEGIEIAKEHQKLLEGSLLERFLSEYHAQVGNRELCYRHILGFRKMALDCGNKSQEQLSYHVEAWCIRQLHEHGEVGRMEVQRALEIAKKARGLVEKYKKFFKETDAGGPAKQRTAQIYILEAQLNFILENRDKALQLLNKSEELCGKDKNMQFEMLMAKCSIAPIELRVSIAELMDEEAPENKKLLTLLELSHQYMLASRVVEAYETLAQAYIVHFKHFTPAELEEAEKRLSIIYRLVQYLKIIKNPQREPKISKCELYEAVGDLYDKYFQTLMPKEKKEYTKYIRENILKNYEKMLECKRNEGDMLRAYQGIGLVYGDLEDARKSKMYFELRLELLKKTGASKEKILDTRVSIFNCMCKLNYAKLEELFEELKEQVERDDTKRELFEVWANYWKDQRDEQKEKEMREVVDSIPDVIIKNEEDETDVLFWRLSNEDILDKCKEDLELIKVDSLGDYKLNKKNKNGETILHEEAKKSNNEAIVERLCRKGCDVNAKDNGGWTPLSEAVTHNEFGNAQVLIRYGADVNTKSTQPFESEGSQSSSEKGNPTAITPLMDACTNGYIDIAELLIDNKARLDLKDSAKWTAYDHLKYHMDSEGADEKKVKFAEKLKILTSKCVPLTDIPTCNIRTKKALLEAEDSSPDEEEDEMILAKAASRKRRISSSPDNIAKHTKRRQRGEQNIRHTPSPVYIRPSVSSVQKRAFQPSMTSFCEPKRFHRQSSSSSLYSDHRRSLSPRRSISPTTIVRSAPLESGRDDDIQVVGVRRSNGTFRTNQTSSPRVLQPIIAQGQVPAQKSEAIQNNSDITVKCYFECSSGGGSDGIRPPVKIRMKKEISIEEVKRSAMASNPSRDQWKIRNVWDKNDKEKAELGDNMLLSHIAEPNQREIALVFHLSPPPAHEVYQEKSKNPIDEVTNRLKQLSTEKQLDLSALFLDSREISEVINAFQKSEIPQNSRICLDFCELSIEDESNLQCLLDECSVLRIMNTKSKTGFSGVFEKTKNRLMKLEMFGIDFRDESQIVKILKSCPSLKSLKLSGIRISSSSIMDSVVPSAIHSLRSLVKLDLSFNASWISDQIWLRMLKELEKLEELTMNETRSDVQFESDWLPNLSSFSARGSDLHWDSIFELLSVLERITIIDVRYSTVDSTLPLELKAGKAIIEVLY